MDGPASTTYFASHCKIIHPFFLQSIHLYVYQSEKMPKKRNRRKKDLEGEGLRGIRGKIEEINWR